MKSNGLKSLTALALFLWTALSTVPMPCQEGKALADQSAALSQQQESSLPQTNDYAKLLAEEEAVRIAQARREVDEKTRTARKETDLAIAKERAALEAVGLELTVYRSNNAFVREQLSLTEQERRAQQAVMRNRAGNTPAGSIRMDVLYDEIVQVMQGARKDLNSSLYAYETLPPAPRYSGDLLSLSPIDEEQKASIAELMKLSDEMAYHAQEAKALATELAWSRLKASIAWSEDINMLRLSVLQKVSSTKRARLLGINRDGIAQLRREITDITLFIRCAQAGGKKFLIEEVSSLKDPFVAGGFVSKVLWIIFLLAMYGYVIRHGKGFLKQLQSFLTDALRSPILIRRAKQVFPLMHDIFSELILLFAIVFSPFVIGFDLTQKYWKEVYAIALWYAVYRLMIKICLYIINWILPGDPFNKGLEKNRLLFRSVLLAGRYILIINIFFIIAEAILGRGYLYHIVTRIAWIGGFIVFVVLIRWWRDGISDAYIKVTPKGILANFVSETRSRWYGFFVAIAAFGVLMAATLVQIFQRFVYSFEQSQRILAYMFRRRLEKKALQEQADVSNSLGLPPEALRFFDEGPVTDQSLLIDFFPHMEIFTKVVQEWKTGAHIGAFAIVGDFGFGKTTWLNEARRRSDIHTSVLTLDGRATTKQKALDCLASGLGAPEESGTSIETLSAWLLSGEKRLVIVDDLHLWFLRSIDSLEALHTFNTIVELTGDLVFWLCSFSNYPFRYYSWASGDNTVFRTVVTLPPWPEKTIQTLLRTRTDLAGWRLKFDDLLLQGAEDYPAKTDPVETAKDYNRLIWDLSLGSPRAAIQYWRQSLWVDSEGVARVRFFRRPEGGLLESLNEQDRFVLACIVWHEQVSVSEISLVLRFPIVTCRDAVLRLKEIGVLRSRGELYRISAQWWPESVRYLKRKHLVPPG